MVLAVVVTDLLLVKLNNMLLRPPIYTDMFKVAGNTALSGQTLLISRSLKLSLLPACEPLHKLRQPSRKGSLNWFVGQPQPLPKLLKVTGALRLV
jgi:hypothetical protein